MHKLGDAKTLLENGQLKRIEIGDKAIVLARRDDEYFAVDPTCTHYGAPLHKGVLHGHTLICPWHHACFDVRTGTRTEPPALDSLRGYPVSVENGQVMIDLERETVDQTRVSATNSDQTYIIVGGGAAGEAAAEELRRCGFAGSIIIFSASEEGPVDRPNLSKEYLAGEAKPEWIPLRSESWYKDNAINLELNTRITDIDPDQHTVTTDRGTTFEYDRLLLATGSAPRTLRNVPGVNLGNIFTLRHKKDADAIIAEVGEHKNVVIIGASFIGMEVASSLGQRGANVTVIDMVQTPFEPVLGPEVGRFLQKLHEVNGIKFRLDTGVSTFHDRVSEVSEVELSDGTRLPADMVIIGIGVIPLTSFLSNVDIDMHEEDQSVLVNEYLQSSIPDIYAAGDIARFPLGDHRMVRIEHWRLAQQHGFIAARNMLRYDDPISTHVPFFWTAQWGTRLRYVGFAGDWDEIVYRGAVQDGDFIAFYLNDGELRAAAGISHDREMSALEMIMKHNLPLSKEQMRSDDFDLIALASQS